MLSFSLSMYGLFVGGIKYLDRIGSMRVMILISYKWLGIELKRLVFLML